MPLAATGPLGPGPVDPPGASTETARAAPSETIGAMFGSMGMALDLPGSTKPSERGLPSDGISQSSWT